MKVSSNWIAHEGSGHIYVEYVIIVCCISIISGVIFGVLSGELSGMYQGIVMTLPTK